MDIKRQGYGQQPVAADSENSTFRPAMAFISRPCPL
jgi:hypothetical protein